LARYTRADVTVQIDRPASGADWQLARQLLLARDGDVPCGCLGLRRFSDDAGEIKRLYVVPAASAVTIAPGDE
jgi:hypothetical protein